MLVMGVLIALYVWVTVGGITPLNERLAVPLIPTACAALTFVITLVLYFVAPTNRLILFLFIAYIFSVGTLATLALTTGAAASTFFPLFIIAVACGGFFTTGGVIVSFSIITGFVFYSFLVLHTSMGELLTNAIIMLLPTIGGYILWTRLEDDKSNTQEDRAYDELATELSELAGKSEVVINAITDGVIALNGQGAIQLINPAAQQLLGWTKHDAITLSYKSILKIHDTKNQIASDANDPVAQAIATNRVVKNDNFSLETQTGKTFMASLSVSPVGQLGSGVIIVFRDITAEKSDERQRAEFISTASHEMRTPVASIEGYLGLALNPATATVDEKARDFITKAHESAQHLGRLFSDLLDVSKADDSRLKNDPEVVDVVPFIHDIVEGLTPKAVEKGLHVLYKPIPSDDTLLGTRINPVFYANVDNDHLREIVQNLVENAIKYTPGGDVVIDVTGNAEHIVISVADTGIGIPREDQAHLFQKFYRVDSSDTREIGGTGLGLYLCRRLTETIGGRIWVESEAKRGSIFYVEIPRMSHDDAIRMIEQVSMVSEQKVEPANREMALPTAVAPPTQPPSISPTPVAPTPTPQPQTPAPAPTPVLPLPTFAVANQPHPPFTPQSSSPAAPSAPAASRPPALDVVVPPRRIQQ